MSLHSEEQLDDDTWGQFPQTGQKRILENEERRPNQRRVQYGRTSTGQETSVLDTEQAEADGSNPTPWGLSRARDFTGPEIQHRRLTNPQSHNVVSEAKVTTTTSSSSRSGSGDPATALYNLCRTVLDSYLYHAKRFVSNAEARKQLIEQCYGELTLWGNDLDYGKLEQCLLLSQTLYISILEVLTMLGATLISEEVRGLFEPRVDEFEPSVVELQLKLPAARKYLLQHEPEPEPMTMVDESLVQDDQQDPAPEDEPFQKVERYIDLLFQLAPQIDCLSDDEVVSDEEYHEWPTKISSMGKAKDPAPPIQKSQEIEMKDIEPT